MKPTRWLSALLLSLAWVAECPAQLILQPGPAPIGGFGFASPRRGLFVSGYFGSPYGVAYAPVAYSSVTVVVSPLYPPPSPRVTVNVVTPTIVLGNPRQDVAGEDLDVVRPSKRFPPKEAREPDMPGKDVSVPRKPVRPDDVQPPPPPPPEPEKVKPPPPKPPPPSDDPQEENARLVALGLKAFTEEEYGRAAQRFRQATRADPNAPRAYFLLAQAEFALGKYRDAVNAIEEGMRRQPNWPRVEDFHPRKDLYKGNDELFDAHLKRLQDVRAKQPDEPTFLFLHAYQLWFDDNRVKALPLFRRARALAPNPVFIDAFLRAAGAMVAVK
jgi:hypothetical protein